MKVAVTRVRTIRELTISLSKKICKYKQSPLRSKREVGLSYRKYSRLETVFGGQMSLSDQEHFLHLGE